jgi:TolA-binding protein
MESNSERDSFPLSSEEGETEMARVAEVGLRDLVQDLRLQLSRSQERVSRMRGSEQAAQQRIAQLEAELEACRNNLQELNLLDGFLRSGAVRAINLENEPTLRVLLTSFLARALQTALDTGAVSFPTPRPKE